MKSIINKLTLQKKVDDILCLGRTVNSQQQQNKQKNKNPWNRTWGASTSSRRVRRGN